jgi:hypothetical protein
MARIKRNLFFIAAVVALALIGFAGFYNFAASQRRAPGGTKEAGSAGYPGAGARARYPAAAIPQSDNGPAEISRLTLSCRAVIPSDAVGNAETAMVYALQHELLKSTNLFVPQTTKLGPEIHRARDGDTFSFDVALALKRPIKL